MRTVLSFSPRRVVFTTSAWVLLALLAVDIPAYAQIEGQPSGVLKLKTQLVSLDVSVLDAKGNMVKDLTRADFTIYENGRAQTVRNFEAFSEHTLTPTLTTTSINGVADLERLAPTAPVTVLVLDEFNTEFSDNAYARLQIKKYLLAQPAVLAQPTIFLVATDAGFQQIHNYTLDRQRLLDSLAHLPAVLPGSLMRTGHSSEGIAVRFAQTLDSLQQVARASIGHKGRKNIIWVGRGFDSLDLRNETGRNSDVVQGAAERAVNLLREAHATIYTIDPTLSTKMITEIDDTATAADSAAFAAETHDPTDPFKGTVSFNSLAPLTGGRAFSMFNDINREIATSVEQGSAYYSMAYVPTDEIDTAHPYRRIDVKVNRPGLTVVTRRGYYAATPPPPAVTPSRELKVEGADIGSAIGSGITFTGVALSASLSPSKPGECIVQVATRDIHWDTQPDGATSAHMTLVAVAINSHGKPVGNVSKDVNAKLPSIERLDQVPFATLTIAIPQGKDIKSVRIAVRDVASGRIGTAEVSLDTSH